MEETDSTTTTSSATTQKTTLSGRKNPKKTKTEEFHIDPEKILKYTRGGGVKTKVISNCKRVFPENLT